MVHQVDEEVREIARILQHHQGLLFVASWFHVASAPGGHLDLVDPMAQRLDSGQNS